MKAAFTRTFNKDSHMSPFAVPTIAKKKKVKVTEDEYGDDGEDEEEDDDDDDISTSGMIKVNLKESKLVFTMNSLYKHTHMSTVA